MTLIARFVQKTEQLRQKMRLIQTRIIHHVSSVKSKYWDGTRIAQMTRMHTDKKKSAKIRLIRVIRVLFRQNCRTIKKNWFLENDAD